MRPNEYDDLLKKIKCSDKFRSRMQEKLSSEPVEMTDYEDSVSGIEIAPKHSWGRVAALAAAFVLVCGAVGGGIYHFNKMKDNPNLVEEDDGASVFEKIKANKDSCDMKEYVWNLSGGPSTLVKKANDKKDRVIEYIEKSGEFKETENTSMACRSVRFEFINKKDDTYLEIDISENGNSFWNEADKQGNILREEYRSCSTQVFYDMLDLVLEDADSDIMEYITKVSQDEIENFVTNHLEKCDGKVVFSPWQSAFDGEMDHYIITDKEALINAFTNFEWVKVRKDEFDYNNYYEMGIRVSESGYLMPIIEDTYPYGYFKLKDERDCEKLVSEIKSVLGYDTESRDATIEEIKEACRSIVDKPNYSTWEGTIGVPQGGQYYGAIYRYYNMSDPESFINEIASLEWVTCSDKEYEDASEKCWYLSSVNLKESGYLSASTNNSNSYKYFKLKNESDKDKILPIIEKYLTMTDCSQLAEKLRIGLDNYNNLESDYVIEGSDMYSGGYSSLRGHLYYDAKNHKMYMNGEGTFDGKEVTIETVMNGEDVSAYRIIDKSTGETYREYTYCIVSPMIPRSPAHYVYASKGIEQMLGPVWSGDPEFNIESRDIGGGKTEYNISGRQGEGYDEINKTIVLTEGGQLISSESNGYSFRLENYVFDSDSFEMVDVYDVYEQINYAEIKRDNNLHEYCLYPELIGGIMSDSSIKVITDSDTTEMYGYVLERMFSTLEKEGGDEDFWMLHGSEFKSGSKHGDRHMKGYYTIVVETEKYEFVIYIPDLRATKPEWGDDTVLIEKHYGTADESSDSYYRHFSDEDLNALRLLINRGY